MAHHRHYDRVTFHPAIQRIHLSNVFIVVIAAVRWINLARLHDPKLVPVKVERMRRVVLVIDHELKYHRLAGMRTGNQLMHRISDICTVPIPHRCRVCVRDAVEKGLAVASALAIGAPRRAIHEAHGHNAVLFKNRHSDIDKLPLIALVESQFWSRIRDKGHKRVWLKIVTRLCGDRCIRNIRAPRLRIGQF